MFDEEGSQWIKKGKKDLYDGKKCQKIDAAVRAGVPSLCMRRSFRFPEVVAWSVPILVTLAIGSYLFPRFHFDALVTAVSRLGWVDGAILFLLWGGGVLARTCQLQRLLPMSLPFRPAVLIILVRNFAVDILPARSLSLFAHAVMLRRFGIDTAVSGASFAVSSVLNAMSVVVLLLPSLLVIQGDFSVIHFLGAMGILLILGVSFLRWGDRLGLLLEKLPWPRWRRWGGRWRLYFLDTGHPRLLMKAFLLGFMGRVCKYLMLFTLFSAFCGLNWTLRGLPAFVLALSGAELSSLLPVSGVAGFGTWELAFVLSADWVRLETASPLEVGLLIHVVTQAWEALWAVVALLLFRLTRKEIH